MAKPVTFKEFYGENFLDKVKKMNPKKIAQQPEIKALWEKSLLWTYSHRKGHRLAQGLDYPEDRFFQYKTTKSGVPLSEVETALLCWAGLGSTGLTVHDYHTSITLPTTQYERRTIPLFGSGIYIYLMFNNDDGAFLYTPHVPTKMNEIEKQEDMEIIFEAFKEGITQIGDPIRSSKENQVAMSEFMNELVYRPGTTVFFPCTDISVSLLHFMMGMYNHPDPEMRIILLDDKAGNKVMCAQHWIDDGYLKGLQMPWGRLESRLCSNGGLGCGILIHNIDLFATAMGLGTFKHSGLIMPKILGATPAMKGLGFQFTSDKEDGPIALGIEGQFMGHVPPALSIEDAANIYYNKTWGPKGVERVKEGEEVLHWGLSPKPRAVHHALKDYEGYIKACVSWETVPGRGPVYKETTQIMQEILQYLWDNYGRIIQRVDPVWIPFAIQVQHPAIDFYDNYFKEGVISQEQREHLEVWHGIHEE